MGRDRVKRDRVECEVMERGWKEGLRLCVAALLAAGVSSAHSHHVMDYAMPATALEGLLSGLGHPVIGIDHLLFIAGAGVLAARMKAANSSGEALAIASAPPSENSLAVAASFTVATTALCSLLTMSRGVPAGASRPYQVLAS